MVGRAGHDLVFFLSVERDVLEVFHHDFIIRLAFLVQVGEDVVHLVLDGDFLFVNNVVATFFTFFHGHVLHFFQQCVSQAFLDGDVLDDDVAVFVELGEAVDVVEILSIGFLVKLL